MTPPSESRPTAADADPALQARARLLCDVDALAALPSAPTGALWKLAESGRQLDANVVHIPAHQHVATHTEPDLDVLLLVVAGHGSLDAGEGTVRLTAGALCWLPHGSTRRITAGDQGLTYLTVHRRRPGMQIGRRPEG